MRRFSAIWLGLLACAAVGAQGNPFLGRWDITATNAKGSYPYWLEVKEENGKLAGSFQDRTGAVRKLPEIALEGEDLVFSLGAPAKPDTPKPVHRAHLENGKLVGELTRGAEKVPWVGVRPPSWGTANASAAVRLGQAVALFNGKDLAGWHFQFADQPAGWLVADGALHNQQTGNNIVSDREFRDFRLVMEYKVDKDSNSGLYLRGRYELQVLDDLTDTTTERFLTQAAIHGRTAPATLASKAPGEWQTMEAILVGNRVTVTLNGQRVHDNVALGGVTGGALDNDELAPGPLMIQGDHGRIWIRRAVVTPITKAGR